jgi:hypothetical protein
MESRRYVGNQRERRLSRRAASEADRGHANPCSAARNSLFLSVGNAARSRSGSRSPPITGSASRQPGTPGWASLASVHRLEDPRGVSAGSRDGQPISSLYANVPRGQFLSGPLPRALSAHERPGRGRGSDRGVGLPVGSRSVHRDDGHLRVAGVLRERNRECGSEVTAPRRFVMQREERSSNRHQQP